MRVGFGAVFHAETIEGSDSESHSGHAPKPTLLHSQKIFSRVKETDAVDYLKWAMINAAILAVIILAGCGLIWIGTR